MKNSKLTSEQIIASAWAAALASRHKSDVVPEGWFTSARLAEMLGKQRSSIMRMMQTAVREGRAEVKLFRVEAGQRGVYPTPHYRLL